MVSLRAVSDNVVKLTNVSRRDVLKLGATAPLVIWTSARVGRAQAQAELSVQPTRRPFGRAIRAGWQVREQPSIKAKVVRRLALNEVIPLLGQVESEDSPTRYNKLWYQTSDGWTYSAWIQPTENQLNTPLERIEPGAVIWGEQTVPVSAARIRPDPAAPAPWKHFFSTTHQVLEVREGTDKKVWYRVSDGLRHDLWMPAEHLRIIPPEEFTPLSPAVPPEQKLIVVDLKAQRVFAFEGKQMVFEARCATGASFRQPDGSIRSFRTTPGLHRIFLKTPSQRMFDGLAPDKPRTYDLPGVAWVSYFTASGISFHGTYWHNDYGAPRSHGCVNLLPEDAQWIYRWTLPTAAYERRWTRIARREEGSLVRVIG